MTNQKGSVAKFWAIVALPRVASQITYVPKANIRIVDLISFEGAQFPKSVILYAVYFYVRFPVSYRDLEEIMAERGVDLDHAPFHWWVEKYAGAIAEEAHRRKAPTSQSWRMDETYVKLKANGRIYTGQSTNREIPMISYSPSAETKPQQPRFS